MATDGSSDPAAGGENPDPDLGRRPRFLVCPPDYYDAHFLFNPWMAYTEQVDRAKAREQWERLVRLLEDLGARLEFMEPSASSPAQVFTADGALINAENKALLLRNDGPRGEDEPLLFADWLERHDFTTESLPPGMTLDGGNILRLHDGSYLVGIKPGSMHRGEQYLLRLLPLVANASVEFIHLSDIRYLQLDMVVGRLGDKGYLVHEPGFGIDQGSIRGSTLDQRAILYAGSDDARNFVCNAITVGDTVVTGAISAKLRREIEGLGLAVEEAQLSGFYKAGGGAKCLVLPLDHWRQTQVNRSGATSA